MNGSATLRYISFLKGVAIIGVVLVHSHQLIHGVDKIIRELLHVGAFGCQLFFVVSGFLMVASWERLLSKYNGTVSKAYKEFIKKRYLSIAPIYILFIMFYQIVSYCIGALDIDSFYRISHAPLSVLANVFLLHGLDYVNFNHVVPGGWFIGTIFLFYLLFPIIYQVYGIVRMKNPKLLVLLPVGGLLVSVAVQSCLFLVTGDWNMSRPGSFIYYSIVNQLPCMLAGMTLNYYLKDCRCPTNRLLCGFFFWGLVGNVLWYVLRLHYWVYAFIPYMLGLSFSYLFIYVYRRYSDAEHTGRNVLARKIEWCGKVSFSAYFTNFIGAFIFPWGMQLLLHHYGYSISGNLLFVLLLIPIFVITFLLVPPVDYIIAYMKQRIGKIVIKEDINGC